MAGNVISMIETGVASAPDVAALNAMTDPLVMIQRIIPRGGSKREAVNVVNALTGLRPKQILRLQDAVTDTTKYPNGGPGLYRFEVTDQQSTAKIVWEARVGGRLDGDGEESASTGAAVGTSNRMADPALPLSPDTINLGNGYAFNQRLKLLTVPDGRILQWDPSQPLPDLAPTFARDSRGPATPIGASMFGGGSNNGNASTEVEALRAELARVRDDSRERERQRELTEMREAHRKELEAVTARMETILEKVTAKPAEDPRVVQLEQQLKEQQRQAELRTEFNAKVDALAALVREAQAQKGPDPAVGVLSQMLTEQRTSMRENLQLLQSVMNSQLTTAQAAALTPEKLITLTTQLKDAGPASIINEKFVGVLSGVMDTVLRMRQAEAAMSSGGGVDWMGIIERLAERAGGAVTAFTQLKARQAAVEVSRNNAETVRLQQQREREAREATTQRPTVPIPTPPPPPVLTGEAARDALASRMFPQTSTVATEPAAASVSASATVVDTPSPSTSAAAVPPRVLPVKVEKNSPLRRMPLKQLRDLYDGVADENFFGPFFNVVSQLRDALAADANSISPDEVAGYVLEARPQIIEAVQQTGQTPIVVQMLAYGQFVYMFARMVPTMDEVYWRAAATALKAAIEAERAAASPS